LPPPEIINYLTAYFVWKTTRLENNAFGNQRVWKTTRYGKFYPQLYIMDSEIALITALCCSIAAVITVMFTDGRSMRNIRTTQISIRNNVWETVCNSQDADGFIETYGI
jgi:hypothetical protein